MDPFIIRGLRVSMRNQCSAVTKTPSFLSRAQSTATKARPQPTQSNSAAQISNATLSWPEYLAIRRNKRKWQTVRLARSHRWRLIDMTNVGCNHSVCFAWSCRWCYVFWKPWYRSIETYHGVFSFCHFTTEGQQLFHRELTHSSSMGFARLDVSVSVITWVQGTQYLFYNNYRPGCSSWTQPWHFNLAIQKPSHPGFDRQEGCRVLPAYC